MPPFLLLGTTIVAGIARCHKQRILTSGRCRPFEVSGSCQVVFPQCPFAFPEPAFQGPMQNSRLFASVESFQVKSPRPMITRVCSCSDRIRSVLSLCPAAGLSCLILQKRPEPCVQISGSCQPTAGTRRGLGFLRLSGRIG